MELSVRPYMNAGIALTAAGAIALTPVAVSPERTSFSVPHASAAEIQLAATVTPADVAALVANLDTAMAAATSTIGSLVDAPSHTLSSALQSAAGLNNTVWDGLIRAGGANPTLSAVLVALKAASSGGLAELARSVGSAGDAVTLTTGQVADLLTSTVTGSLGTAMQAVASIVHDPLAAASYIGLLTTPIGLLGLALQGGVNTVAAVAITGAELASTLVDGVSAQIANAVSLVNNLLQAGKTLTDIALVDGALTALQGIVSAPVTAGLAAVTGITAALTDAAAATVTRVAGGVNTAVATWLGNGSMPGAVQAAIARIGAAPLSPASYTDAVSILVGAAVTTVQTVIGTASSFASMPFRVAADLTGTGAEVVNAFAFGIATAAGGLLQAAGMPAFVAGLPHNLATVVAGAVNVAAFATSATLNTIATAIDVGQAIGGIFTSVTAAPRALEVTEPGGPTELPSLLSVSGRLQPISTLASPATTEQPDPAAAPPSEPAATDTPEIASGSTEAAETQTSQSTQTGQTTSAAVLDPNSRVTEQDQGVTKVDAAGATDQGLPEPDNAGSDEDLVNRAENRPSDEEGPSSPATDAASEDDDDSAETYGRHAAAPGKTTATAASGDASANTSGGRHRRDDRVRADTANDVADADADDAKSTSATPRGGDDSGDGAAAA